MFFSLGPLLEVTHFNVTVYDIISSMIDFSIDETLSGDITVDLSIISSMILFTTPTLVFLQHLSSNESSVGNFPCPAVKSSAILCLVSVSLPGNY